MQITDTIHCAVFRGPLFVILFILFWTLYCLSLIDLRLLITLFGIFTLSFYIACTRAGPTLRWYVGPMLFSVKPAVCCCAGVLEQPRVDNSSVGPLKSRVQFEELA